MTTRIDNGSQFFNLTVIMRDDARRISEHCYLCKCVCGKTASVRSYSLRTGRTRSCGCLRYEVLADVCTTHGFSSKGVIRVELRAFYSAKNRCTNPKHPRFADYGGRGIEFRFGSFEEFFAELGSKPTRNHSVDRINNDGHYEKGNVRWATRKEQVANRRISKAYDEKRAAGEI
jgi:hypothetical protein